MKYLKIAFGLALATSLMAVSAAPALAAGPTWKQCRENAGTGTKWEDSKCSKASSIGKWEWREITATEKVTGHGTLQLKDTKVPIVGTVEVHCSSTGSGLIGPGKFDQGEQFTEIQCTPGKGCEKIEKNAEPKNLPWQSELYTTEKTIRDRGTGSTGKAPGWAVTCKVLGVVKTDECVSEEQTALVENLQASGTVKARFDSKSGKGKCTVGGASSGELEGETISHSVAGWAISVS